MSINDRDLCHSATFISEDTLISDPIICVGNVWRYLIPPGSLTPDDKNDAEMNNDDDVKKFYQHAKINNRFN